MRRARRLNQAADGHHRAARIAPTTLIVLAMLCGGNSAASAAVSLGAATPPVRQAIGPEHGPSLTQAGQPVPERNAAHRPAFAAAPAITALSPSAGPLTGGTPVTITGTNLTGAVSVKFGSRAAQSFTVLSATQLSVIAPAGSGMVDVRVSTPSGVSRNTSRDNYQFMAPPTVARVAPFQGPQSGGTAVTISGRNLSGASAVTFGGTPAKSFRSLSSTSISAVAPAGAPGIVDIAVTTPGGVNANTAADDYRFVAAPTITAVTPAAGPKAGATTVTITGTDLIGASSVRFGTKPARSVRVLSPTQLTATAPPGSGVVDVTVTTRGGSSSPSTAALFTYAEMPAVTGVSPSTGPQAGGERITLTGTNLARATSVRFGTTPAQSFEVISATQISAVTPPGSGLVDVSVTTPGGTSSTNMSARYAYVPAPSVTALSPLSGTAAGGTAVVLSGANLSSTTEVKFGATAALAFTVLSPTSIRAVAPPGAGAVAVTVKTPAGNSSTGSAINFSYLSPALLPATHISAGQDHSCRVRSDWTVSCWGRNDSGEASPPAGSFTQIAVGRLHSCGIRFNGSAACWGKLTTAASGTFTQISSGSGYTCGLRATGAVTCWGWDIGSPSGTFTQVSAGWSHACAIRTSGTVFCWGNNEFGQASPPSGVFTAVSSGPRHSCAIRSDGFVSCWGRSNFNMTNPPGRRFSQISAGFGHTCGIQASGPVACWGYDGWGELTAPTGAFTQLSVGDAFTCGSDSNGAIACWGWSEFGEATPPSGPFADVAVGSEHVCGLLRSGGVICWGRDRYARASPPAGPFISISAGGDTTCGVRPDETAVCWDSEVGPTFGPVKQVSPGYEHSCSVKGDSTIYCWGDSGPWGRNAAPAGTFTQVTASYTHSCGIRTNGMVACWGWSALSSGALFKQVSAGNRFTCGIRTDDTLECWGPNEYGQAAPPEGTFTDVASGSDRACGLRSNGTVSCWGLVPSPPPPGAFMAISVAEGRTCGVRPDGTIECWGGQLTVMPPT
jgi:alpha-tubulin suppressor-like RCC1 family protein